MAEKRYTLGRYERLKRRKYIEELFNSGESFSMNPFKVFYLIRHNADIDDGTPGGSQRIQESILQFGTGVSKKNFKKAVHRNRIKRLIREVYRTENSLLKLAVAEKKEWCLKLFILYTGKEMPTYAFIEEKLRAALVRLGSKLKV